MRRVLLIASILTFSLVGQTNAAITVIPQPDVAYQAATTKIDVASVPDFTSLSSITDGTLTVSFDTPLEKRTVPDSWSSWSSPPNAESPTPALLWDQTNSLTMSLSRPVTTFGFELEPDPFSTESFDVDFVFLNGPAVVGTISLSVNGEAGARLFAATTQDLPFDQIVINGTSDFAIAQVRYVLTPQDLIANLIAQINALVTGGQLASNKAKPLITKLESVSAKLDNGQSGAACNQLGAFINQVNAYINSGTLTAAQGQALIASANAINFSIGC